jgi:hypothetical protein
MALARCLAAQRRCGVRWLRPSGRRRFITGFRLVAGSWKIMPMRPPRTARIRDSGRPAHRPGRRGGRGLRRCRRSRAAAASAPVPSCSCRSRTRPPAQRSRRADRQAEPSMARTTPASASSSTLRFSMVQHVRRLRQASQADARAEGARARVEGIAHAVGEQVGRQHQRHHEAEGRGERPPDHRVAAHLVARHVDHAAEAVHRRVDADADVGEHRLVQDQRREARAPW